VHGAFAALKIHDVEFFVEERVELDLVRAEALVQVVEHFLVHVVEGVLVFADLEELAELFRGFGVRVKVHFQ